MAKKIDIEIEVDTSQGVASVNNLNNATEKLANNVNKASTNATKSTSAFIKLGTAVKALATASIVLKALDTIVETLQSLDGFVRLVDKGMAALRATVVSLSESFTTFGDLVKNVFTLNFDKAKESALALTQQLKDLPDTIQENVKQAVSMSEAFRVLRDEERKLNLEIAARQTLIEKNKFIAEDETRTFDERIKAAKTAFELESQIAAKRIQLEEKRINLIKSDTSKDQNSEQTLNDINNARIAILQAQNDQYSRQTELNNKINQLQKERIIIDEDYRLKSLNLEIQKTKKIRQIEVRTAKETQWDVLRFVEESSKKEIEIARDKERQILMLSQATANGILSLGAAINDAQSKNAKKQFNRNKALSISEAIINGAVGTTVALRDPTTTDPVTKALYVASIAATTAATVVKISSTKYNEAASNTSITPVTFDPVGVQPNQPNIADQFAQQIQQQPVQAYISATDVANALEARKMIINRNKL